jgi:hypothetical protein
VTSLVGRTRGLFFFSHHPWIGVVVLVVLIGLALYMNRNRR